MRTLQMVMWSSLSYFLCKWKCSVLDIGYNDPRPSQAYYAFMAASYAVIIYMVFVKKLIFGQ